MRQRLLYIKRSFAWHDSVKAISRIVPSLLSVGRLVLGHLNPNVIKASFVLASRLNKIRKTQGMGTMCKYMKACTLYTYHYISVMKKHRFINSHTFDLPVSLTSGGIPRIFPTYFRNCIRMRKPKEIRYILTILGLYRVLPYPGKVKLSTITDPFKGVVKPDVIKFIPVF